MLIFPQHDWRLVGFRGLVAAIFGVVIIVVPGISLRALIVLFGIYVLLDSLFSLFTAIRSRKQLERWGVTLTKGVLGTILALLLIILPGISAVVVAYFLGAWFILLGVFEIITAVRLRRDMEGEAWLILAGIVSIGVGVFLFVWPAASMVTITLLIGIFTLLLGIMLMIHAWRIRRRTRTEG